MGRPAETETTNILAQQNMNSDQHHVASAPPLPVESPDHHHHPTCPFPNSTSIDPTPPMLLQCNNYHWMMPQRSPFVPPSFTEEWKTGLYDCMQNPINCLATFCFPCLTFGQIAEILDNGETSCATSGLLYGLIGMLIGCPWILSCSYRTKLRNRFGLVESPAPDWLTHLCCEYCALCQAYRELHQRGIDPSIGWAGNMEKVRQYEPYAAIIVVPPPYQTMN